MYAFLVDGDVARYPLSLPELRRALPHVSFTNAPAATDLAPLGVVEVHAGAQPPYDPDTQTLVEGTPILEGARWREQWTVQALSAEERDARLTARRAAMVCSRAQGKLALLQAGLLDTVEAWIAGQARAVQIEYEERGEWWRNWPLVVEAGADLGLTDTDLDDLFTLAATL